MIIASCGHKIENKEEFFVAVKDMTPTGRPQISYETVCKECYEILDKEDYLLYNDEDERKYLFGNYKIKKR